MNTTFGYQNNNNPIGIQESVSREPVFELYPNPASSELNVSFKGNKTCTVYSSYGQRMGIYTGWEKIKINTGEFPPGMYLVRCGKEVKRFVVRH